MENESGEKGNLIANRESRIANEEEISVRAEAAEFAEVFEKARSFLGEMQRLAEQGFELSNAFEELIEGGLPTAEVLPDCDKCDPASSDDCAATDPASSDDCAATESLVAQIEALQALVLKLVPDSVALIYKEVTGDWARTETLEYYYPTDPFGYDPEGVRREIAMSSDGFNAVDRAYLMVFNRIADKGGREHWMEELAAGRETYVSLVNRFLGSGERKRMEEAERFAQGERSSDLTTDPASSETPPRQGEQGSDDSQRIAPQYMMAPNVRFLTTNAKIEVILARMHRANLNGLHIPWSTDWYSFSAADYSELDGFELNGDCFEMLENVRRHCERDGVYLHVWIYGQESRNNALISVTGKYSEEEKALFKAINDAWRDKPYITFGLGFDLEEWVDVPYAEWVKSQLPDVKLSMRHPDGLFDEIADIPSMMHRRFETADLEAFAAKYPEAEMIFTEDRCRNHDWDWADDSYAPIFATGHFTAEEQQRIYADCVRLGISCIYGRLEGKEPRYGRGSAELDPFGSWTGGSADSTGSPQTSSLQGGPVR